MKTRIIITSILLTFLISCKKGETGPQGVPGEKGETGTTVINSQTYHFFHIMSWNEDLFHFYTDDRIGYNDAVLCFLQTGDYEYEAMPTEITYKNNNLKLSYYWNETRISIYNDNAITNPIHYNFKAVIIKDGYKLVPGIKEMSYAEVLGLINE